MKHVKSVWDVVKPAVPRPHTHVDTTSGIEAFLQTLRPEQIQGFFLSVYGTTSVSKTDAVQALHVHKEKIAGVGCDFSVVNTHFRYYKYSIALKLRERGKSYTEIAELLQLPSDNERKQRRVFIQEVQKYEFLSTSTAATLLDVAPRTIALWYDSNYFSSTKKHEDHEKREISWEGLRMFISQKFPLILREIDEPDAFKEFLPTTQLLLVGADAEQKAIAAHLRAEPALPVRCIRVKTLQYLVQLHAKNPHDVTVPLLTEEGSGLRKIAPLEFVTEMKNSLGEHEPNFIAASEGTLASFPTLPSSTRLLSLQGISRRERLYSLATQIKAMLQQVMARDSSKGSIERPFGTMLEESASAQ